MVGERSLINRCQNVMRISKSDWECFHGLRQKVGLVLLCRHIPLCTLVYIQKCNCVRNISLRKSWILPILDMNSHEKVMNFRILNIVATLCLALDFPGCMGFADWLLTNQGSRNPVFIWARYNSWDYFILVWVSHLINLYTMNVINFMEPF